LGMSNPDQNEDLKGLLRVTKECIAMSILKIVGQWMLDLRKPTMYDNLIC